jgi:hypothetical protein
MDERTTSQPTKLPTISDADYEQMYHLLMAYRFGSISFIALLEKWKEILGLLTEGRQ